MTLLIKPIDLQGVKIVPKKIRENPTSVDPPYRPEVPTKKRAKMAQINQK